MVRWRFAAVSVALVSVVATLPGNATVAGARTARAATPNTLHVYEGSGTWVDMFNAGMWRHPVRRVKAMHRHGVRTIYIETSNYKLKRRLFDRTKLALYLKAAHRRGMSVVAWYVPSFERLRQDLRRSLAAIRFQPSGQHFDGFAMDIEATVVRSIRQRNHRLRLLSRRLRSRVGDKMALGAIVPNPATQTYWHPFPYRQVASHYDVFLPMTYWTYHYSGYWTIYRMVTRNVSIIRSATGISNEPVHVIGGLANLASRNEVRAMINSSINNGVTGASLYDYPLTKKGQWRLLRRMNP